MAVWVRESGAWVERNAGTTVWVRDAGAWSQMGGLRQVWVRESEAWSQEGVVGLEAPGWATFTRTVNSLTVAWNDQSTEEDRWRVEFCQGASCTPSTLLVNKTSTTKAGTGTQYTHLHSSLSEGLPYRYRARAETTLGDSGTWSSIKTEYTKLGLPTTLVATGGDGEVVLTWNDNSSQETGYQVYRCQGTTCTPTTLVHTTAANAETWTDTGVTNDLPYRYRVRAIDTAPAPDNFSDYSNIDDATPAAAGIEHQLVPDSQSTSGGCSGSWTGNHTAIDETDTPNDTDFVQSKFGSGAQCTTTATWTLSNPSETPLSTQTHTVRVRVKKVDIDNGGSDITDADITVKLLQGATQKASQDFNNLTTSWSTKSFNLSQAEIDSITDYNDLKIEVDYKLTVTDASPPNPPEDHVRVDTSWAQLYIPA